MISKKMAGLAFVAGCVLALGATTSAQAQHYYAAPQPYMGPHVGPMHAPPPPPQAFIEPQPAVAFPPERHTGPQTMTAAPPPPPPGPPVAAAPPPPPPEPRVAAAPPPPAAGPGPQMMDTRVVSNEPQASRGDFGDWSPRRNVIESARYERLLQTNMGFRQARMRQECGPINDPQLHAQCLASFDYYEPVMVGTAVPPRPMPPRAGY
jgi:hypothetical protein